MERDYIYRDKVLREYITNRDWDTNPEFQLVRQVVNGQITHELLKLHPYLYDYEWEMVEGRTDLGKGDLLLTNGRDSFLIVEIKFLDSDSGSTARTRRTKKRTKVIDQTFDFMVDFQKLHNDKKVFGLAITNEGVQEVTIKGYLENLKKKANEASSKDFNVPLYFKLD